MIKPQDFFYIDNNNIPVEQPINRIAFSSADVKYKVKCIKAMQDLGMQVTIDKIGNIYGTIPGKLHTDKSVICGSHTDSVENGGQFDGSLGVYAALKPAEDIVNSGKQNSINYKAIIYTCEESTRFGGKACLGSKYLRGDNLDFDSIESTDGFSLKELVANYKKEIFEEIEKNGLSPISEVDKVIEDGEIVTAIEGHIEQADVLRDTNKEIGICTSIVAPYRLKAEISDIETAAEFICFLIKTAQASENLSKYRVPDIQFLETSTPTWGANQISDCCEVKFVVNRNMSQENILKFYLSQKDSEKLSNVGYQVIDDIQKSDKDSGLFIDVRQQIGMSTKLSSEMIFETIKDIIHKTHCNCYMNITAKGEPYQTNPDLVESALKICEDKKIKHKILQSWAGHDLATLTSDENARTLLLFCPNTGGSHNPHETVTIDAIANLSNVQSALAQSELERANELFKPIQDLERE